MIAEKYVIAFDCERKSPKVLEKVTYYVRDALTANTWLDIARTFDTVFAAKMFMEAHSWKEETDAVNWRIQPVSVKLSLLIKYE